MTKGQSFKASNEYHQGFFNTVVELATEVSSCAIDLFHESDQSFKFAKGGRQVSEPTSDSPPRFVIAIPKGTQGRGVTEAGKELCQFIDPHSLLDSNNGPRWPLVILAFDKSHVLMDNPKRSGWTLFSELR